MEHKPFFEAEEKNIIIKEIAVSEETSDTPFERNIEFELLKRINPDIIGWLYIPQIDLDQPILKGEKYLSLDYEGNYDKVGSIFTYDSTNEMLSDTHLILFGHNMNSGQMFGNLDQFQNESFREVNNTLYIYTPDRTKELQIAEVFKCQITEDFFQTDFLNESDYQIISLVTCTNHGSSLNRLVVNCRVTKEKFIF